MPSFFQYGIISVRGLYGDRYRGGKYIKMVVDYGIV